MLETQPNVRPKERAPWQLIVVAWMGCYWAVNFLIAWISSEKAIAPLGWLPLLGFGAPILCRSPRRRWRWIAFLLCVFEACLSPLLWFGSFINFMDPQGFDFRVFGVRIFTIWSLGGQFVYFAIRGLLFAVAAFLVSSERPISSNETNPL